jgi:hypothetical protein
MSKVFLLGANREIDTDIQTVAVNQIVHMEGYNYDKYVVYEIAKNHWGITYKLINLRTREFDTSDLIRPFSEKFGIGMYYDDVHPQFLDAFEVAILREEAEANANAEAEAEHKETERKEQLKAIGRECLQNLIPSDAQAVIVAELHEDDSDPMTDYYAYNTVCTVILGFSTYTKDLFSEMRKYASNFEGTAHLAEENEKYEHREKYTGGAGYYLGESRYSGWIVRKEQFYGNHEQCIERFALTAGEEKNVCVKVQTTNTHTTADTVTGNFQIVNYSEKALAVFGDTRAVKDELKALGGRFNPKLSHEGNKRAGWIFQKSKEQELKNLLIIK